MSSSVILRKSRFTEFRQITELLAHAPGEVEPAQLEGLFRDALAGHVQRLRDTYQACLGRLPEAAFGNVDYPDSDAAARHLAASLTCDEFLNSIASQLAASYPTAPRKFFLHIPKTAGSSVKVGFDKSGNYFVWDLSFDRRDVLLGEKSWGWLFQQLGFQHVLHSRPIIIAGHVEARALLNRRVVRSFDDVFTVVRHPEEMVVSALNYAFTTIIEKPGREDAIRFGSWVEAAGFEVPSSREEVTADMVEAILLSGSIGFEWSRILHRYLSLDETISGALDAISVLDMDVVDFGGLIEYMKSRHDIELPVENRSHHFVPDFASLSRRARIHVLSEICREDLALYDVLVRLMDDDGVLRPARDLTCRSFAV